MNCDSNVFSKNAKKGYISCGNKVALRCYPTTNTEIVVCGICDGWCENKAYVNLLDKDR